MSEIINNVMRHQYRKLEEYEKARVTAIKNAGLELWELLDTLPPSREVSLAKTKTEEAVMWAVKSIT